MFTKQILWLKESCSLSWDRKEWVSMHRASAATEGDGMKVAFAHMLSTPAHWKNRLYVDYGSLLHHRTRRPSKTWNAASPSCLKSMPGSTSLKEWLLWDGQRHILLGDKNQIHSLFSLLAVPRLCGSMSTLCICKALSKAMQTAIYPRHTQISICARLRGRHNQNKHGPCCQLWLFLAWLCQK